MFTKFKNFIKVVHEFKCILDTYFKLNITILCYVRTFKITYRKVGLNINVSKKNCYKIHITVIISLNVITMSTISFVVN